MALYLLCKKLWNRVVNVSENDLGSMARKSMDAVYEYVYSSIFSYIDVSTCTYVHVHATFRRKVEADLYV